VLDLVPLFSGNAVLTYHLFSKVDLGPGRLLVFASFVSFGLTLLTIAWVPLSRALNWLLLPLGQQALTAYTLHLFVVACLTQAPPWLAATALVPEAQHMLLQTTGVLGIWVMLRLQPLVVQWWDQNGRWLGRERTVRGLGETTLVVADAPMRPTAPSREPVTV